MLGPGALGSYALLFFLTGLVTQIIHLLSKPGTMMRTFGISDDDADDIEEDDESDDGSSHRPTYTLGVGMVWTLILSAAIITPVAIFQTQIASFLLHDSSQGPVVLFATITGAVWAIFKLAEMVIWFEGRAMTFALIDAARPAFNITAIIVILSTGRRRQGRDHRPDDRHLRGHSRVRRSDLEELPEGASPSTELKEILKRGAIRIPIATSLWVVQNSDSFILSRFLDHKSIGLYNLASRTGFMVAFLPQGFRMALRPIRKTAMYEAFRREYGIAVAQGQLLAYFYLLTLTAILAMVLGGEILIVVGGPKFASVAPLVPLTAAAMSMPALFRTIAMSATYNNRRKIFVSSAIFVGCSYLAFCIGFLECHELGDLLAAGSCDRRLPAALDDDVLALAVREEPHQVPLRPDGGGHAGRGRTRGLVPLRPPVGRAHPDPLHRRRDDPVAMPLFVLRIIPKHHWGPISHIVRSALGRHSALQFNRRAGLRAIGSDGRDELRAAVLDRVPDDTLVPDYVDDETDESSAAPSWMVHPDTEGARLVRLLRTAGSEGGIPLAEESEVDAGVSLYLFSDQPVAVRLRRMRQLLSAGVDPHELRTLDDLRNDLAKANDTVWTLGGKNGKKGSAEDNPEGGKRGKRVVEA